MLAVGMASYEQWYHGDRDEPVKQLLTSLWKGSRYLKVNALKILIGSYIRSIQQDPVHYQPFYDHTMQILYVHNIRLPSKIEPAVVVMYRIPLLVCQLLL